MEAAAIAGLALLLSMVVTSLRPDVVAFLFQHRADPPPGEFPEGIKEISVLNAFEKLKQGSTVFVDARSPEDFRKLRIRGAISLPESEKDAWLERVMQEMAPDTPLIAYCSDSLCHLAQDLTETLVLAGFQNVRTMKAGLKEWESQGLPMESGD